MQLSQRSAAAAPLAASRRTASRRVAGAALRPVANAGGARQPAPLVAHSRVLHMRGVRACPARICAASPRATLSAPPCLFRAVSRVRCVPPRLAVASTPWRARAPRSQVRRCGLSSRLPSTSSSSRTRREHTPPLPPGTPPAAAPATSREPAPRRLRPRTQIVLFMKGTKAAPQCGFSNATVQIFLSMGVPFETARHAAASRRRCAARNRLLSRPAAATRRGRSGEHPGGRGAAVRHEGVLRVARELTPLPPCRWTSQRCRSRPRPHAAAAPAPAPRAQAHVPAGVHRWRVLRRRGARHRRPTSVRAQPFGVAPRGCARARARAARRTSPRPRSRTGA